MLNQLASLDLIPLLLSTAQSHMCSTSHTAFNLRLLLALRLQRYFFLVRSSVVEYVGLVPEWLQFSMVQFVMYYRQRQLSRCVDWVESFSILPASKRLSINIRFANIVWATNKHTKVLIRRTTRNAHHSPYIRCVLYTTQIYDCNVFVHSFRVFCVWQRLRRDILCANQTELEPAI